MDTHGTDHSMRHPTDLQERWRPNTFLLHHAHIMGVVFWIV